MPRAAEQRNITGPQTTGCTAGWVWRAVARDVGRPCWQGAVCQGAVVCWPDGPARGGESHGGEKRRHVSHPKEQEPRWLLPVGVVFVSTAQPLQHRRKATTCVPCAVCRVPRAAWPAAQGRDTLLPFTSILDGVRCACARQLCRATFAPPQGMPAHQNLQDQRAVRPGRGKPFRHGARAGQGVSNRFAPVLQRRARNGLGVSIQVCSLAARVLLWSRAA